MKKHILIVDDEATIRDLLSQFFTNTGYQVTAVASAAEALKGAERDKPDLIISDLQLEDSDGLQMIARLKELLPKTPVILLTGVLFDADVVKNVLENKVACYLDKTSSLAKISETVRRVIEGGK